MIDRNIKIVLFFIGFISFCVFNDGSIITQAAADEDITISANTTWNAGTYTYRDITLTNNAVLTLNSTYSSDTNGTGVIINARTVTVDSGSSISANGKGYATGAGTGKGSGSFGSGAGYGGVGAVGETGTAGGVSYGSAVKPLDLGSGGGNSGGAGGGAINLNLTGNLVLGGTISANGNNGSSWRGSGSGGSVYINAVDMSGTGTVTANGGTYTAAQGGGGRVALYYTGLYSLDTTKVLANKGGGTAANGSVFIFDKGNKDLSVSSSITLTPYLGIDGNGDPATNGIFNLRNLTVANSASLIVGSKYTTDSDGSGIEFILSGDLTVDTGAKIDAKGQGYQKGSGEGKGVANSNLYGGGGAHGGNGGRGEVGAAGTKYDSTLFPSKLGSGGVTSRGAAGGGIIKVTAGNIIVNGSLDASASAPSGDGATNGSGGAGGTIFLKCSSVTGDGFVLANGSNGYGYSGGGGGGRIAIYADTSAFTASSITAAKGLKGGSGASADGGVGTVFLYNTVSGNVTASSDVTFEATQGVSRDGTARTDGVFYFNNLTITNNATITIGGTYSNDTDGRGVTINLDGALTVDSGAKITATGQGYAGANGPGRGTGTTSTSGSGGSYGGTGGKSYNNNLAPAVYGATVANYPYLLGSGGGNGYNGYGVGGKGGGAVTLRVLGAVLNNGEISANGAPGTGSYSSWVPGGGSGGSLFLVCNSLSGVGNIWAKGGDGLGDINFGSGAGGGGRISVVYADAQSLPLANFSATSGAGGGSSARNGAEGSVNITQRILPAAEFTLKNPNNNSTEFTNTENVKIVPTDETVEKYKEAATLSDLVPTFYADGWANVVDGKDVGTSEGTKTVKAWFKDGNELISSSIGSATITLDKTQPGLTIGNNNQTTESPTITIEMNLNDNLSGVDYLTVSGVRIVPQAKSLVKSNSILDRKVYAAETSYQATVDLAIGSNEIPIVLYDKAGNSTDMAFAATRALATAQTPSTAITSTSSTVASSTTDESTTSSSASSAAVDESDTERPIASTGADEQSLSAMPKSQPDNSKDNGQSASTLKLILIILGSIAIVTTIIFLRKKPLKKKK